MHPPVAPWLDRYVGSRTGTCARRPVPNSTTWHPQTSVGGAEVTIKGGGVQLFTCTSNHDFPGCLGLHSSTLQTPQQWALGSRPDRVPPALDWHARALMESTGVRSPNAFSRPRRPKAERAYRPPRRLALLRHSHSIRVRHEPCPALPDISGRAAGCARWRIS